MRERLLGVPVWLWILTLAFANATLAFPDLDLVIASLFHDPEQGFFLGGTLWERLLYRSVPMLTVAVHLWLMLAWLGGRVARAQCAARPLVSGRDLLFLLALLVLVPGLAVNQGLKAHWGRARPVELVEFGGAKQYSPALRPSTQGGGAFSSGHAAAAFHLAAVAATLRGPRSPWFTFALGYALAVGAARIAAGGHFLSDVLASGLLVWIGWWLLRALLPAAPRAP